MTYRESVIESLREAVTPPADTSPLGTARLMLAIGRALLLILEG